MLQSWNGGVHQLCECVGACELENDVVMLQTWQGDTNQLCECVGACELESDVVMLQTWQGDIHQLRKGGGAAKRQSGVVMLQTWQGDICQLCKGGGAAKGKPCQRATCGIGGRLYHSAWTLRQHGLLVRFPFASFTLTLTFFRRFFILCSVKELTKRQEEQEQEMFVRWRNNGWFPIML